MNEDRQSLIHLHSNEIINGDGKIPTSGSVEYGEIAIGYADGYERMYIRNDSDEIVSFSSDDKFNESFRVMSKAMCDLDDRVLALEEMSALTVGDLIETTTELENVSSSGKTVDALIIKGINNRLTGAETSAGTLNSAVNTLEASATSANTRISTLESSATSVNTRLDNLDSSAVSANTRITTLEASATSANTRISTLESSASSVNNRLDTLESSATSANTRIATLESSASSVNTRLDNLDSSAVSANTRISTLESSATSVNTRLDGLETSAGTFNTRISDLEASAITVNDVIYDENTFKNISTSGKVVDAYVVSNYIKDNEFVVTVALNELNDRIDELSAATPSLETTIAVSGVSAITVTVGEETSNALVVPFAYSAQTLVDEISPMTEITWSELKSLRDSSGLTPGMQYRITDYVTKTVQEDTQSANHQFDIIAVADSVDTLNENVRACLHSGDTYFSSAGTNIEAWELKYCLDNDTSRFVWADSGSTGRGVIYYMKDEWNNECPYDFKNIQFKPGATSAGTVDDVFYYTFSLTEDEDVTVTDYSLNKGVCYYNKIGTYIIDEAELPFNMFRNVNADTLCCSNTFGDGCFSNTFGDGCYSNTFEDGCYSNTFGDGCFSNTFGNDFASNIFGEQCDYNAFGKSCQNNTFGRNCSSNTFGYQCQENTFGAGMFANTFGDNCFYNTIRSGVTWSNTFGNDFSNNTIGRNCQYNTFGNYCESNTFGNNCESNAFGNYCSFNTLGDSCVFNTFGNCCTTNDFGDHCDRNAFGNSCSHNAFGDYCQSNTFGNSCEYNCFGDEFDIKSYYRYIIFENGNGHIRLNCSGTTSSSNYYQNVKIAQGVNNTTTYKDITDGNVNQNYQTVYQPTNSQVISV